MGFQDCLWDLGVSYASDEAIEFADRSMELISWHALLRVVAARGRARRLPSYTGSKWDRGLLPIDTIDVLASERGQAIEVDRSVSLDWEPVRESIRQHGMRNSNTMAIAPTATISNIQGVTQSIEPIFTNLFVKSQPLRRVHHRQRVAGGRTGSGRSLESGTARRDQVLGRLDRRDRERFRSRSDSATRPPSRSSRSG